MPLDQYLCPRGMKYWLGILLYPPKGYYKGYKGHPKQNYHGNKGYNQGKPPKYYNNQGYKGKPSKQYKGQGGNKQQGNRGGYNQQGGRGRQ